VCVTRRQKNGDDKSCHEWRNRLMGTIHTSLQPHTLVDSQDAHEARTALGTTRWPAPSAWLTPYTHPHSNSSNVRESIRLPLLRLRCSHYSTLLHLSLSLISLPCVRMHGDCFFPFQCFKILKRDANRMRIDLVDAVLVITRGYEMVE
jgi:hypothetical protein